MRWVLDRGRFFGGPLGNPNFQSPRQEAIIFSDIDFSPLRDRVFACGDEGNVFLPRLVSVWQMRGEEEEVFEGIFFWGDEIWLLTWWWACNKVSHGLITDLISAKGGGLERGEASKSRGSQSWEARLVMWVVYVARCRGAGWKGDWEEEDRWAGGFLGLDKSSYQVTRVTTRVQQSLRLTSEVR